MSAPNATREPSVPTRSGSACASNRQSRSANSARVRGKRRQACVVRDDTVLRDTGAPPKRVPLDDRQLLTHRPFDCRDHRRVSEPLAQPAPPRPEPKQVCLDLGDRRTVRHPAGVAQAHREFCGLAGRAQCGEEQPARDVDVVLAAPGPSRDVARRPDAGQQRPPNVRTFPPWPPRKTAHPRPCVQRRRRNSVVDCEGTPGHSTPPLRQVGRDRSGSVHAPERHRGRPDHQDPPPNRHRRGTDLPRTGEIRVGQPTQVARDRRGAPGNLRSTHPVTRCPAPDAA